MADNGILIDTTILIDFLRKKNKEKALLWTLREEYENSSISSISVFELYAGATDEKKITDIQSLLKWFDVLDFDKEIGEMAGKNYLIMKKLNNVIDFRDLFIGTTAVFYNLRIATLNTSHFESIPTIQILKL